MKNTRTLKITFSILVALSLIFTASLLVSARRIGTQVAQLNVLSLIRTEISERTLITDTYILYRDKTIGTQLEATNERMTKLLADAENIFADREEHAPIEKLAREDLVLREIDDLLFAHPTTNAEEEELLKKALAVRSDMLKTASNLSITFRNHMENMLKETLAGVVFVALLLALISFLNLAWFKRMIEKISVANEQLDSANAQMKEARKEQDRVNEELHFKTEEMVKSEKELQQKVSELERFNKLTVDRELKMIELKNKLRETENKS